MLRRVSFVLALAKRQVRLEPLIEVPSESTAYGIYNCLEMMILALPSRANMDRVAVLVYETVSLLEGDGQGAVLEEP
jgi:hypothetical protein